MEEIAEEINGFTFLMTGGWKLIGDSSHRLTSKSKTPKKKKNTKAIKDIYLFVTQSQNTKLPESQAKR